MFYIHSGFELTWLSSIKQVPLLHYKIIYWIYNIIIIKYNFQFCDLCGICEGFGSSVRFLFLVYYGELCFVRIAYGHRFGHSGSFFSFNTLQLNFCGFYAVNAVWFLHSVLFSFLQICSNSQHQSSSLEIVSIDASWRSFRFFVYLKWFTIGPFIQSISKKGDKNRRSNNDVFTSGRRRRR